MNNIKIILLLVLLLALIKYFLQLEIFVVVLSFIRVCKTYKTRLLKIFCFKLNLKLFSKKFSKTNHL